MSTKQGATIALPTADTGNRRDSHVTCHNPRHAVPARWFATIWLLTLPALWYSLVAAPVVRVEIGQWGDHTMLRGVHGIEQSSTENYRWTTAQAVFTVPNLSDRYRLLRLRAHGWRPDGMPLPRVRVAAVEQQWAELDLQRPPRIYAILLPDAFSRPSVTVTFNSDAYEPPGDPRTIGFALDWIELRATSAAGVPVAWQFAGQALLVGLALALIASLTLPRAATLAAGLAAPTALLGANLSQPLWISLGLAHWLIIVAGLLAATWLVMPRFVRRLETLRSIGDSRLREPPRLWISRQQARIAWALLIAALFVRLAGAAHPLFDARDMPVHTRWLTTVAGGELYLYSTPAELQNRTTFNPPAGYILLLPVWLALGEARLTVQIGVALADALIAPLLLLIARELGLSARAGLFAMALYVALPIVMTMMWWGFATNALAQACWALLLWLLLRLTRAPDAPIFAFFTVAAILCFTMHIGALVVLAACLGLVVLAGRRTLPRAGWRAMAASLALAAAFTVPVYFVAAAAPLAGAERGPATLQLGASLARGMVVWPERIGLVGQALNLGFLPPILGLAATGAPLLLAIRRRHPLQRTLMLSALVVCLLFFAVYVGLSLLTRYIYFATPLVCLAAGLALARLAARPGGRWIAAGLTLFVAWSGVALWLGGVLLRIKPSLVPLTQ